MSQFCFFTTRIMRKILAIPWNNPVADLWLYFCPNVLSPFRISLVSLEQIVFQKLLTSQLFGWSFCVGQQDSFYSHQDNKHVIFFKKSRLFILVCSVRDGRVTSYLQMAQNWNLWSKIWLFFHQYCQPVCEVMQKEVESLEFLQGEKIWIYRFAKKTRNRVLVNHWRMKWKKMRFKSLVWYCYCWKTRQVEYYLH